MGLARETVNIVLQDFRQRGLIEMDGRRIRVTDQEGLRLQSRRERRASE